MNHIISVADPEKSWCGQTISAIEQPFRTLDQAALNGIFPSKKPVCKECIELSVHSLLNNLEVNNDNSN